MSETEMIPTNVTEIPSQYSDIFQQLNQLNRRGYNLSQNAVKYKTMTNMSLQGLQNISEKVELLARLIGGLKSSVNSLSDLNTQLQGQLDSNNSEYDEKIRRLNDSMS